MPPASNTEWYQDIEKALENYGDSEEDDNDHQAQSKMPAVGTSKDKKKKRRFKQDDGSDDDSCEESKGSKNNSNSIKGKLKGNPILHMPRDQLE